METATVNEKGQITIPSKMRKELNIKPGNQLRLFTDPGKKASLSLKQVR